MALVIVAAVGWGGARYAAHVLDAPGPLPEARNVVVPRGGAGQAAEALADASVVARPLPFRLAALLTSAEGPLRAGEFTFPAGASLRTALAVLRTARPVQHHVTIPEGVTAKQVAAVLDRAEALTGGSLGTGRGQRAPGNLHL